MQKVEGSSPFIRSLTSRAATFLASFALLVVVAFADGGYFRDTWVWLSLALASLVWITLALRTTIVLSRLDLAAVAALAAFAAWVALSAAWSPTPAESLVEGERALLYVAALLAFVVLVERELIREHLAGIAAAVTLVTAFSVADRLIQGQGERDPVQGTLLFEPLGYANALGIFVVLGILVAFGLGVTTRSRREAAVWLAASILLAPALVWTASRGAWLALLVGMGVLVVSARTAIAARVPSSSRLRGALAGLAAVVAVGMTVAFFESSRLLGSRADYWRVAWDQWGENAWLGAGAGTFVRYWQREPVSEAVLDAHSLYLEVAAELGLVGLALLVCALVIPLVTAMRARADPLASIAAGAYSAYLVHAGLDWDWEMPAVTLGALLVATAGLAAHRDNGNGITVGGRGRFAIALVALAISLLAVAVPRAYSG